MPPSSWPLGAGPPKRDFCKTCWEFFRRKPGPSVLVAIKSLLADLGAHPTERGLAGRLTGLRTKIGTHAFHFSEFGMHKFFLADLDKFFLADLDWMPHRAESYSLGSTTRLQKTGISQPLRRDFPGELARELPIGHP
jgi:hypothetical protein